VMQLIETATDLEGMLWIVNRALSVCQAIMRPRQ